MAITVIVGAQWGDEGKGKLTDLLAADADVVVRYQGGNNAGHTVVVGRDQYKLHLIPSGILYPDTRCLMGDGTVIDPECLAQEHDDLTGRGVSCDNLHVSGNAHVIMPYHRLLDALQEDERGADSIGTTRRGIGPVYTDKTARDPVPVRMWDLLNKDSLRRRVDDQLAHKNVLLKALYDAEPVDVDAVVEEVWAHAEGISDHICDTRTLLFERIDAGDEIVMEGAQGTFLDLDYGTYPFVTSSHPVAGGACLGTGIGPTAIDRVIMVAKAYSTRVGSGPFPTEQDNEIGDLIRERGQEYGTTTGRPRRCGWLDGVALRTAARINGATSLGLTLLDVLDGFEKISVCTAYQIGGQSYTVVPSEVAKVSAAKPVFQTVNGWRDDVSEIRRFEDLPGAAREYVSLLEEIAGVPVEIISVGPAREQTIRHPIP